MKVLIVDDNEDCILLLRQTLDSIPSVEVTAASSVAEAWWHLTAPNPHISPREKLKRTGRCSNYLV